MSKRKCCRKPVYTCGSLIPSYTTDNLTKNILPNIWKNDENFLVLLNTNIPYNYNYLDSREMIDYILLKGRPGITFDEWYPDLQILLDRQLGGSILEIFANRVYNIYDYMIKKAGLNIKIKLATDSSNFDFGYISEENIASIIQYNIEGVILLDLKNPPSPDIYGATEALGKPSDGYYYIKEQQEYISISIDNGITYNNMQFNVVESRNSSEDLRLSLGNIFFQIGIITEVKLLEPNDKFEDRFQFDVIFNNSTNGLNPNQIGIKGNGRLGFKQDSIYTFKNIDGSYHLISDFIYSTKIINMRIYQFDYQTIMHEFLHVLGLIHAHQIHSEDNPYKNDGWIESVRSKLHFQNNYLQNPNTLFKIFDKKSIMSYNMCSDFNNYALGIEMQTGVDQALYENFVLSPTDICVLKEYYGVNKCPPQGIENFVYYKKNNKYIYLIYIFILLSILILIIF
jgi:hypothetical protein